MVRSETKEVKKVKGVYERGIAVYDPHTPHEDKVLFRNILKFARDFKPSTFLFGGDNLNMNAVDHWIQEGKKKMSLEGRRVKKDYEYYLKNVHYPLLEVLPRKCRKIWLKGNHEDWIKLAIDKNPNGEGYWEIENNIPLDDWEVYEYNDVARVGKLRFTHGHYYNKYHAAKTVDTYARSIVVGHAHTHQCYTKIVPIGNEPHCCYSVPCACNLNPHYKKGQPNQWVNGFAVFYVYDNGKFNFYPVIALNGHFVSPDGKLH